MVQNIAHNFAGIAKAPADSFFYASRAVQQILDPNKEVTPNFRLIDMMLHTIHAADPKKQHRVNPNNQHEHVTKPDYTTLIKENKSFTTGLQGIHYLLHINTVFICHPEHPTEFSVGKNDYRMSPIALGEQIEDFYPELGNYFLETLYGYMGKPKPVREDPLAATPEQRREAAERDFIFRLQLGNDY